MPRMSWASFERLGIVDASLRTFYSYYSIFSVIFLLVIKLSNILMCQISTIHYKTTSMHEITPITQQSHHTFCNLLR
jgi:hypothetical protein